MTMKNEQDSKQPTIPPLPPATGSARTVQRISKFLRVVSDPSMPDERGVMSNDNKLIAIIGYYKLWREWVLYPQPNTVWSTDCLVAIKSHLAWMSKVVQGPNEKHKRQGAAKEA